jgi:hypothetical protein
MACLFKKKSMIAVKMLNDKFLACCGKCGQWLEVAPHCIRSDTYFAYWESPFSCCGVRQTALFTVEKDEVDIH